MAKYDFKLKSSNIRTLNNYMLAKTLSMFEYSGLPETIPAKELERILQTNGYAFITKAPDDKLYAFSGGLTGTEKSPYGQPTEITISNVALNFTKNVSLKEGVLIESDDMRIGLMPLFEKGNTIIAENEISMMLWGYNSRNQKMISAPDDKTKASAELYLKKLVDGELSVIGENGFFEGVNLQSAAAGASQPVTQFIELQQYIKASMFNEVGLSALFNMKRERLISSELDQAEDSIFALVYNMIANRIIGIKALNEMFGLNINIDFGSVWKHKERDLVDGDPETPDTDSDNDADTDSDTDSDNDADNDSDTDSDNDADTDSDTDQDTDSDNDSDTDQDNDSDTDVSQKLNNTDTDTDTDTDTEAKATDTDTDTEQDGDPDTDTEQDGDNTEEEQKNDSL